MWEIREGQLTLEEAPDGLVLRGRASMVASGPEGVRAFEVTLGDEELGRLADAIEEYFLHRSLLAASVDGGSE